MIIPIISDLILKYVEDQKSDNVYERFNDAVLPIIGAMQHLSVLSMHDDDQEDQRRVIAEVHFATMFYGIVSMKYCSSLCVNPRLLTKILEITHEEPDPERARAKVTIVLNDYLQGFCEEIPRID